MAYDKQLDIKFRHFKNRILELEKAAEAQDRALKQLAEKIGIQVDLSRALTPEEESEQEREQTSSRRLQEDREVIALLEESNRDES
jgi:hypothetical protein